jgi:superfamily II DNA helicase RecQ
MGNVSDAIRVAAAVGGFEADVRSYNGQRDDSDNDIAHKWWACANNALMLMVATSAFGTDIDAQNIRAIVMLGHTVGSVGQLIKIAMLRVKNALPFLEC